MSHLIKIYTVCKFSYFRLWHLKINSQRSVSDFVIHYHLACIVVQFFDKVIPFYSQVQKSIPKTTRRKIKLQRKMSLMYL